MRNWLLASVILVGCSSAPKAPPPAPAAALPATIQEAVQSTAFRSESNRPRDQYRHPEATLEFFGVKPNMTVVEISPGTGWYQEILAPLLTAQGHYIAASPPARAGEGNGGVSPIVEWQKAHPEVAAKISSVELNPPSPPAPAGTADMVLTFRNVHNWMAAGNAQEMFNAFFAALKPGGVLGVVEHRAFAKGKHDLKAKSGYVRESDVIAMARKAGFKLDKKSEINANAKDTKNYPEGVWTLPPTLRLKDKDRDRYLAIGESDRMTLRFVKR
jgi:predicted methyltransferase